MEKTLLEMEGWLQHHRFNRASKLSLGNCKIKKLKVKTVVDLGCGSGDIIIHFCKRHKELRGVGLDIDKGAIQEAKKC